MNTRYQRYLNSHIWKVISAECKREADYQCQRCGSTTDLQAHHLHYRKPLGMESPAKDGGDLQCVCSRCHRELHGLPPLTGMQELHFQLLEAETALNELY